MDMNEIRRISNNWRRIQHLARNVRSQTSAVCIHRRRFWGQPEHAPPNREAPMHLSVLTHFAPFPPKMFWFPLPNIFDKSTSVPLHTVFCSYMYVVHPGLTLQTSPSQ